MAESSKISDVEAREALVRCRQQARGLRVSSLEARNAVLMTAADELVKQSAKLLDANARDLAALPKDASAAFRDRLLLDEARIRQAAAGIQQVAALPDPINEEVGRRRLPNGLLLKQVRVPLGVIFLIFESRPNVALEAFSLAFKSGNVIVLRGGKESRNSTGVIYDILTDALTKNEMSASYFWGITDPDRDLVRFLLGQKQLIDIAIPRGGDGLIEFVVENARMPIIKNDRGMCHVYVHDDAAIESAVQVVENAKTQRPGVCNAMETVLVHEAVAPRFLPALYERLEQKGVQWFCCERSLKILEGRRLVAAATPQSWETEYLDLLMNCRVVSGVEEAIEHIESHGSRHSESIVTETESIARKFQSEVDSAAVYWNASTRFTDGFEFGLGGEIGISTQKLHVRGPVGLRELTSVKWVIDGSGQIRS